MIRRLAVASLALAGCLTGSAAASDGSLAYKCRGYPGFDSGQDVRLAQVRALPAGRSHFHRDDDEACPIDRARCKGKAYVVPGDVVLVDRVSHGWACAWFAGAKGGRMGYLAAEDLRFIEPATTTALEDWLGEWNDVDSDNTLRFTRLEDRLLVAGEASWHGGTNDAGYQNVHTGEIGDLDDDYEPIPVAVQVRAAVAVLEAEEQYDCGATFQRLGEFLLVEDNAHCGGMNVRFNGVYRRKPTTEDRDR